MTAAVERTTKLNQIVAVRAGVRSDVEKKLTKHYHLLQRAELLNGLARTYQPLDSEGYKFPDETTQVQVKATTVLREVAGDLTRLFDTTAALDWSNQEARADVVLLGGDEPVTLVKDAPVSYLMFLEKALVNLETLIRKLPVLPSTETWKPDPATDTYRSEPIGSTKTAKIRRNHVLYEATDRHPAQVESYSEDVPIGTWTTVKFSGALPAQDINKMLDRVVTVAEAVKFAREQANLAEVVDPKPGRRILEYVIGKR
jgi:hypothetical protein